MRIQIKYNGDSNLPKDRNHMTKNGREVLSKTFKSFDEAICFWLECDFYSGAVTTLEEIFNKEGVKKLFNNELKQEENANELKVFNPPLLDEKA